MADRVIRVLCALRNLSYLLQACKYSPELFTALHIVHRGICHTQPFGGRGSHFLTGGGEVGNIIGNNIRGIKDFLDIFFCRMDIFHQAFNGFTDIAEFLPCIFNQFVLLFYGSN